MVVAVLLFLMIVMSVSCSSNQQEDCVRTILELSIYDALCGIDPATAHLQQQDDEHSSPRHADSQTPVLQQRFAQVCCGYFS